MAYLKSPGWIGIVVPWLMVPQSQVTYEGPLEGIFDVRLSGQELSIPMLSGRSAALFGIFIGYPRLDRTRTPT